jgi:hypothetical protein
MTTNRDIETVLDDWFVEGPERIADWVVDDALLTIQGTPQTRGVLRLPRRLTMVGPMRLAGAAAAVVAVVLIGAGLFAKNSQPGIGSASSSPIATPQATPSPGITASPSPTPAPSVTALPGESVFVFPGTYVPKFNPGMKLTVDDGVVAVGCAAGEPNCHGQVDTNLPGWLAIEFGPPQFDIQIFRVDKLNDPRKPGKLIDPPSDLASWIGSRPGVSILNGPTSATVGGLPATQIEIRADRDVEFGPIPGVTDIGFGLGKGSAPRMYVLQVQGHPIVISLTGGFGSLQPLVNSIVWQ